MGHVPAIPAPAACSRILRCGAPAEICLRCIAEFGRIQAQRLDTGAVARG